MTGSLLLNSLQSLLGWVDALIGLTAAAFAASYYHRSRWAGVLAVAFTLGALNLLGSQLLIPMMVRNNPPDAPHRIAEMVLGFTVLGVVTKVVSVVGVIGLLVTLRRAQRTRELGREQSAGAA